MGKRDTNQLHLEAQNSEETVRVVQGEIEGEIEDETEEPPPIARLRRSTEATLTTKRNTRIPRQGVGKKSLAADARRDFQRGNDAPRPPSLPPVAIREPSEEDIMRDLQRGGSESYDDNNDEYPNEHERTKGKKKVVPKKKVVKRKTPQPIPLADEAAEDEEAPKRKMRGHIPALEQQIVVPDGAPPPGLPVDGGQVLIGYKRSWAAMIYRTKDHKDAVRLLRAQSAAAWKIEEELEEIKRLVEPTGLLAVVNNAQEHYDAVTCSLMAERYYPETWTFHFPFGEVGMTLDDPEDVLGLKVRGLNPLADYSEKNWNQLKELAATVLGWSADKTDEEFRQVIKEQPEGSKLDGKKLKAFKLTRLKDEFGRTKKRANNPQECYRPTLDQIRRHANAYILYTIGTLIFPGSSGNKVSAQYLQFLDPPQNVGNYAWGTAALAYLMDGLADASRLNTVNLKGNFSLLQAFAYDHFPELAPKLKTGQPPSTWVYGMPTATRCVFTDHKARDKEEQLVEKRSLIDGFTKDQCIFDPYNHNNNEERALPYIGLYHGPLLFPKKDGKGIVMYDPRRFLRQLGKVQTVPRSEDNKFTLVPRETVCNDNNYLAKYDPEPPYDCWTRRVDNQVTGTKDLENDPRDEEDGYSDWYDQFSHPYVINAAAQLVVDQIAARQAVDAAEEAEREAKRIRRKPPLNPKDAVKLVTTMVKGVKSALKKWGDKLNCGQALNFDEQKKFHKQLSKIMEKGEGGLEPKVTKRPRQDGRGPSGALVVNEEESDDDDEGGNSRVRGGRPNKRGR